jgi:hypothetical protein
MLYSGNSSAISYSRGDLEVSLAEVQKESGIIGSQRGNLGLRAEEEPLSSVKSANVWKVKTFKAEGGQLFTESVSFGRERQEAVARGNVSEKLCPTVLRSGKDQTS